MKATNFSSLHPQNLLASRSEPATKASEPRNSYQGLTRPCKRIDAGFLLPSIHRRRESGRSNARGCLFAVSSSRHPRSNSLRLACVDAKIEAEMGGVAGQQESVNGRHAEGRVHERRPQHRRLQDRRPRMACPPRCRTFFFSASKKPVDKQK